VTEYREAKDLARRVTTVVVSIQARQEMGSVRKKGTNRVKGEHKPKMKNKNRAWKGSRGQKKNRASRWCREEGNRGNHEIVKRGVSQSIMNAGLSPPKEKSRKEKNISGRGAKLESVGGKATLGPRIKVKE